MFSPAACLKCSPVLSPPPLMPQVIGCIGAINHLCRPTVYTVCIVIKRACTKLKGWIWFLYHFQIVALKVSYPLALWLTEQAVAINNN